MVTWPDNTYILIPSYKSADLLCEFIPTLLKFVPHEKICIVDDASGDHTEKVCSDFKLQYLKHDINRGKGAALDTGFRYLIQKGARWIITMDADGQHAPEDLAHFTAAVSENPATGICIGKRCMKRGVMPFARICSNRLTSGILSIFTRTPILDSQCGYRIYSTDLLKDISIKYHRFEMESEVILKAVHAGFQIIFTDVQTLYLHDLSHISHLKDTIRWVRAVVAVWFSLRKSPAHPEII